MRAEDDETPRVLVFLGSSRQGAATIDALLEMNRYEVFATTRSGRNADLEAKDVTVLPYENGSAVQAAAALDEAKPSLVFFSTLMGSREVEGGQGKVLVDAIKEHTHDGGHIDHVVFSSVVDADKTSDAVGHFKSKLDIEKYLKTQMGLSCSILRPAAFLDNFDDAANFNPLTKGVAKSLWPPTLKVKYIATRDVGKAAAAMLADPLPWRGRTLDCATEELTGEEVASVLSKVSGVDCEYEQLPMWLIGVFMSDLSAMVDHFEKKGYSARSQLDLSKFLELVPDAWTAQQYFESKGKWSVPLGERFKKGPDYAPSSGEFGGSFDY